jgi:hypothetical protein
VTTIDAGRWRSAFRPLDQLLERAQNLRFRLPEEEEETGRLRAFATALKGLIAEAIELLGAIQKVYEKASSTALEGQESDDSLLDIGRLISAEVASQEVFDVLFLARAELRGARQELVTGLRSTEWPRLASSADTGFRALKKSLIAIESSLYEYEGMEPPQRVWADLEVSLAVRRLYARLRHELLGPGEPDRAGLFDRVETAVRRFRALRDSDIYPLLRFDDRQTFVRLRDRMEDWLHTGREPAEGDRIWQDLTGFLELLKEVNYRQELRQHDRTRLRQAYRQLFGPPSTPPSQTSVREELEALVGLDSELDAILLSGGSADPEDWKETLARLLRDLSGMPNPSPSPGA